MYFKLKKIYLIFLLFALLNSLYSPKFISARTYPVDRIVAVVNDQVITLSDLKIVIHFHLFENIQDSDQENYPSNILDRIINQKVVIKKSREDILIEKDIAEEKERLIKGFGSEREFFQELAKFDLDWIDLKNYLKEKIYFKKIIQRKFQFHVPVTLEEIEKYYQEKYLPQQKSLNLFPKSLIEVASEIEFKIADEKREILIKKWLQELRNQAEIEIKIKNLKEIISNSEF